MSDDTASQAATPFADSSPLWSHFHVNPSQEGDMILAIDVRIIPSRHLIAPNRPLSSHKLKLWYKVEEQPGLSALFGRFEPAQKLRLKIGARLERPPVGATPWLGDRRGQDA